MAIRVILIDDEPGIRLLLRKIIEKQQDFEVVGESGSLAEAVTLFTRTQPQVVFLDIEMNGASGIDCARIIADMAPKTKIIFATAHDEYMPEAFEVYAFDYLVKPFQIERVNRTLERIRGIYIQDGANGKSPEKETADRVQQERGQDRLLIRGRDCASFVNTKDIILIQRENGNTVIYTAEDFYVTSASLGEMESRLDPAQFLRSHKSYIINISKVKRIEPYGRWTYVVILQGLKKDALITAEKYEELKKRYD